MWRSPEAMGLTAEKNAQEIFAIVATVLHLGNTGFVEENGEAVIAQDKPVAAIAKVSGIELLLGILESRVDLLEAEPKLRLL